MEIKITRTVDLEFDDIPDESSKAILIVSAQDRGDTI